MSLPHCMQQNGGILFQLFVAITASFGCFIIVFYCVVTTALTYHVDVINCSYYCVVLCFSSVSRQNVSSELYSGNPCFHSASSTVIFNMLNVLPLGEY